MQKIIAIVGPTASGKTALALNLAQKFRGEIIAADSRTVFRGLDIGTAKPTRQERKLVPHHLLDVANVGERFTVVQFQKLAQKAIEDIIKRGKIPFLVGGTGLYVDAVLYGYQFPPEGDPELRYHLEKESDERLREILQAADPETYKKIDLHNPRRVVRAVEVALGTGRSFLELKRQSKPLYKNLILGLVIPRDELHRRIEERFDQQLAAGLLEEVRWVLDETSPDWVASLGLAYRWLAASLGGVISQEEAIRRSKKSLRNLAKRQLTWFKRNKDIHWASSSREAEELIRKFLTR